MHSKTFVSDDKTATVGTMNPDTLEQCHQIQPQECKGNLITRLLQNFLRVFAALRNACLPDPLSSSVIRLKAFSRS